MKQKIFFLALIGAFVVPQALHAKACVNPVTVVCPTISCSSNVVYISQANVGPGGYTIDAPGVYCLIEDITWAPPVAPPTLHRSVPGPSSPIAAITITASNVLLNLNGYTLQQSGDADYTVGIFITNGSEFPDTTTPPLSNVIVKNGTVQNIATAGILVNKVNEFLLEDLYVTNNGSAGYILCPCGAFIAGGVVYTSFLPSQTAPFLKNHIWRNVHADSNSTNVPEVDLQGAGISAVDNVSIESSTFNSNVASALNDGSIGLTLYTVTNISVINCQANDNVSAPLGVEAIGSFGFSGYMSNFVFENCQANNNSGLTNSVGFLAFAAYESQIMNGVFSNCTATGNSISGDGSVFTNPDDIIYALGFAIQSENEYATVPTSGVTFINCVANNQTSTVTGFTQHNIHAYGFSLEYVTDVQMEGCIACNNTALVGTIGDGEGFYLDVMFATLTNCRAEYNSGVGYSQQYDLYPWAVPVPYNVNIINCTALGNPTDPIGIGIYALAPNTCVIEGCVIESNVYDGILFDEVPCPYTANNVVKHNQILAPNPVIWGSSGVRWAIEDLSAATGPNAPQNTYYDNYAWNYPGDNGLFTNYSTGVRLAGGSVDGLGNAYIAPWVIGTLPPSPTGLSKITNLDITNGPCVSD